MEMAGSHVHDAESFLDSQGEDVWQQLRRQFELADGFWLGFVFCPSPRTVAVLRRRTGQILKFRAQRLRVIRPSSPDDFGSLLPALFEPESAQAGCVWIESIHTSSPTRHARESGDWTLAWDRFLLRANERRDALRRRLDGGLILAAPPEVKPRVRDAAPDLWSIRSLVLDLPPSSIASSGGVDRDSLLTREIRREAGNVLSDASIDVEFGLAEADRIARRIEGAQGQSRHGLARILLRAVEGLLEQGKTQDAVERARKAVAVLRGQSGGEHLLADALSSLSRAARADNDISVALECLEESLVVRRRLLDTHGETSQALRDLSISLGKLGDLRLECGELPAALAVYDESLALDRRLLDTYGETPQALRDLSISLGRLGDVRRETGDVAAATTAYEESLVRCRRLLDAYGETPQALRDLSISLGRLGDVRRETGDVAAAAVVYEESLALRRRLVDAYGETSQALRDLSISLSRLGDVRRETGDVAAATAAYEESLALDRRLLDTYGETPQALRNLSISLDRLGDVRRETGDVAATAAAYEESLALDRRLVDTYGETPQALRDLSISLGRLGNVRRETGDVAAATTAYEESLVLCRRLVDAHGETPQALRDLSISLGRLGNVRRETGDMAAATVAYEESLALRPTACGRLRGDTPGAARPFHQSRQARQCAARDRRCGRCDGCL